MEFNFMINDFEGPLDLLLHLIKENKMNIMDIEINTKLYQIQTHDKDIEILKIILKEHNVNTRPKQLEAIRHYQALIPRNIIGGSSFISVLAFAISIIALILDDKVYYNEENLKFIFTLYPYSIIITSNMWKK